MLGGLKQNTELYYLKQSLHFNLLRMGFKPRKLGTALFILELTNFLKY